MARGFPLFTDNHVQQAVVEGLRRRGWDVVRAIDAFPERTKDDVLFAHAAKEGRVFLTNDEDLLTTGADWLHKGWVFPGLVYWPETDYAVLTTGDILRALEALAAKANPFAYPIQFVQPPGTRPETRERFKRPRRDRR